ncbi:hypothetical protein [Curtobacterium sp. ISL-83]|uniref:hypothetical protein n=1 Tax=Curtobacterium sp. ISL-83 TaxID=2819145 RepID=UPI001BECA304|nr:hypothetical protein [Curtobacterium sp. ISL-83]MBT2501799.1 hypothetical protein [Curtobacterium sp. ISL-83]
MRARVLVSVAVAASIALGATGCEFMSPAQTKEIKQITDGVNVTTGKLDVRNALLISDDGTGARFVGTLVNSSDSTDLTVSIEVGDDTQTVQVPSNSHVDLAMPSATPSASPSDGAGSSAGSSASAGSSVEQGTTEQGTTTAQSTDVVFPKARTTPGSLVKVYFSYDGAEGVSARVPVLTSTQEEYATLAPSPTPSSTATSPSETGTQPTGKATAPGTQPSGSSNGPSSGKSGTNG